VTITAPSNQGVFYALSKLEMLGADGRLAEDFQIGESPAIARRGLAETFSGSHWSHGDRLETLRFLGLARMNRYVYAPKDDDWRDDYAERDLERFRQLLRAADENFVLFVYAFRPGSSIVYSSDEDVAAIIRRLEALSALGARGFALCFDDAPVALQNGEDLARFKTLASAHARLVNLVHGRLKQSSPDFELYVAPAVTTSTQAGGDYLKELGAAIPQDVLFLLPGAGASAQAAAASGLADRRPLVWDNFAAGGDEPWRLFIGPKRDASATLIETASGFIATAARNPRASMLPIATAADYAWDWRNYNPQQSFDRALNLLYDERARQGLRVWARLYDDSALKPLFQQQAGAIDVESMRRRLAELQNATEMLGVTLNQGLLRGELARFIERVKNAM
jgi:hyaluronoglucosaminidase